MGPVRWAGLAAVLLLGAGPVLTTAVAQPADRGAELRLHWDARQANDTGPLARAGALAPGLAPPPPSAAVAEVELRGTWRPPATPLALAANALLLRERPEGAAAQDDARFNELHASADLGAWQASAGKKIVGWDVGYGFRPNDVVQQEERRTLLATTPEGRPLLQMEHFGAESAAALVWVNPQRQHRADEAQRLGTESALAARLYRRTGSADWHLFARRGHYTGHSLGAALAWVATDALELHASARALQRHDSWRMNPAPDTLPATANPWQMATRGGTSQWLAGLNWTGLQQHSLIAEWWHDGTALPDAEWDRWRDRNTALAGAAAAPGLPAGLRTGLAGTLAWQSSPLAATSLRRDNLFVRLAWQPGPWQWWADLLYTPADAGRAHGAGLQWQGDRWRVTAALRVYGGPADAVLAQLPQQRTAVLAATAAW